MTPGGTNVLRRSLWPFSPLYGLAVSVRNRLYDRGLLATHRLPAPVLSVGNLTVGGTGKTPLVLWLVNRARESGLRPGVLARGYGRAPGAELNDEGLMLHRRFPDLLQVQEPDRVAGGRRLVEMGADVLILDDGFQHRRLHRDRNIVCLDARRPFADGVLLPAGDLREPRRGLLRADLVILSRAQGLDHEALEQRIGDLRRLLDRELPVFASEHRAADLHLQPGGELRPVSELQDHKVVLLSGIARPDSLEETVRSLGAEIVHHARYRDHHRFRPSELENARSMAQRADAWLVTTEKDDARLRDGPPRVVLRLELCFLGTEPSPEQLGLE